MSELDEREALAHHLASVRWDNAATRMDRRQFWRERADEVIEILDRSWSKVALDRLQELAEERGYSRGFDIGWKSHEDLVKRGLIIEGD